MYFECPRRLSGTIRRLAHLRVQIADALLPFIVFAPLFVRQAHIGFQFQCLDLLSEKVDKLDLEFFDGIYHTVFSTQRFWRISGEEAQMGCTKATESCRSVRYSACCI